tara:strand:- start:1202 stop:1801 length:600 start_codon:yes stop_codon:yes gene_type:complete
MKELFLLLLIISTIGVGAQERPIKIETKELPNRLAFYALNENEQDFDVLLKLTGTNFRQSQGRPRFVRVPGASKVHLKTIVLMRGKKPNFAYDLVVNDSLSKRALKVTAEAIKIRPKKSITIYITERCNICDSIVQPLERGKYVYKALRLNENPKIKDQLSPSFGVPMDSISEPIVNLGGRLFTNIVTYEQLMEALEQD